MAHENCTLYLTGRQQIDLESHQPSNVVLNWINNLARHIVKCSGTIYAQIPLFKNAKSSTSFAAFSSKIPCKGILITLQTEIFARTTYVLLPFLLQELL
jgi:hypothetical protein